jgi:hypothetical protein
MKKLLLKAFQLATAWHWHKYERALSQPRQTQMQTLNHILKLSTATSIESYEQFKNLPQQSYEDLEKTILVAQNTEYNFLSKAKPITYEPTSGSSGARKLIPYTSALLNSFTQLFMLWAHDLLRDGPRLNGGRLYFSVSPQFHETEHGLADDSDYLTGPTGWLFKHFSLVPAQIKRLKNPSDFFFVLALYLLAAEDLEVISIWSPSFLLAVLEFIQNNREKLLKAGKQAQHTVAGITFRPGTISVFKQTELAKQSPNWPVLFPALKLISCWGAHNSAQGYHKLKQLFPNILVQEKGLLATEAPLTFPSERYGAFLPLLHEVFFEFMDPHGQIFLIDELEIGQTYELLISQKSGLLRYQLKDQVKVDKKIKATPCFQFIGRSEAISDLVGEKLNENFIAEIAQVHWPDIYLCLLPNLEASHYTLFSSQELDFQAFEKELAQSPHYHNARQLQQLNPLMGVVQPELEMRLKNFFSQERGMRLGDIKDRYLYSRENDGVLAAFLAKSIH